jgi:myosin V
MREMVNKDTQNLVSNSFLLDDDLRYAIYVSLNYHKVDSLVPWVIYMLNIICLCSIPFSTEDLSMAIPAIYYADVDLPESLQHYPAVQFLHRQQDPHPPVQ